MSTANSRLTRPIFLHRQADVGVNCRVGKRVKRMAVERRLGSRRITLLRVKRERISRTSSPDVIDDSWQPDLIY